MSWLVSIINHPTPAPRDAAPALRARKDQLLALWSRHVPATDKDGQGDYELFFEQAVRLEAALDTFGPENVWLVMATDRDAAVNAGTGERRPASEVDHLLRYGVQASKHHQDVDMEQARLSGNYYRYEAFLSRTGRRLALCGLDTGDSAAVEVGDVLASWAADGIRRAFLKATRIKYAAFPVDLPEDFRPEDAGKAIFDELGYGAMNLEGERENLIAQEFVPMEFEYRVFVVGNTVVTAAGCVEEFTPLDNDGHRFDNKLRRHRQAKSPVEAEPQTVGLLINFARDAVDALALEVPELTDYVIDVAIGADGEPLIVELNSLLNSGLYASQQCRVTAAMAVRKRDLVR
ncbi:ATP-grasp domain-containing protein [Paeniglutamicibacter antarcticus]|uniref:ATP-grasp domain-containing protein n=1 Tax=Arthrobacter terrae TaxID=2935737 RepID=A0A931G781_9MICC|nr:ATP-grasp domain-containing protein [Arthrobacter terrae]MBG0739004.1 ATP-grasp domain-containing protein [Arthrobacter terrae]